MSSNASRAFRERRGRERGVGGGGERRAAATLRARGAVLANLRSSPVFRFARVLRGIASHRRGARSCRRVLREQAERGEGAGTRRSSGEDGARRRGEKLFARNVSATVTANEALRREIARAKRNRRDARLGSRKPSRRRLGVGRMIRVSLHQERRQRCRGLRALAQESNACRHPLKPRTGRLGDGRKSETEGARSNLASGASPSTRLSR